MNIIEIKKEHIRKAAEVLTLSFKEDPIFKYIFNNAEKYDKTAPWFFSTWVRWAVLYGRAWMTEDGNAVVLMRSTKNSKMSLWSMIRAGMLPTPYKLGSSAFRRFYFQIVSLLYKKHVEIMGNTPHWYGWMIGVNPANKGIGRQLMNHCFEIADRARLPIFLETSTERNVSIYNHKEFEVKQKIIVEQANFPLFFMVRQPKKEI